MADLSSSKDYLSGFDLEPEELRSILERIDDNLAFWQVIYNERALAPEEWQPLPSLAQLGAVSDWLKMSSAPLRPSLGVGGVRGFILRSLNLFVRFFGSVQIDFNRKFREFLAELMTFLHEFEGRTATLKAHVNELEAKIQTLETANKSYQQEFDLLTEQIKILREKLDRAIDDYGDLDHKK